MGDSSTLLIEDNRNDELLTLRALKASNMADQVVVVRDGAAALDYLFGRGEYAHRADEDLPNLVLLDLKLPKVDGLEVLKELRADSRTELVPVVVLTSSNQERDVVESYRLGANSYIRKPVDFSQFAAAVVQLGLYWLVLNEPPPQ